MTIDKNKKISKNSKGGKKSTGDSFSKKEWIPVKSPHFLGDRLLGNTLVEKISNSNQSLEKLKNRVYEISLADLKLNEDLANRKIKFKSRIFENGSCLTDFFGMELTRDKICSLVRKWQTIIDSFVDLKTKDGYFLRIFVIAFSKKKKKQFKKHSYFTSSQIRAIRRKIIETVVKEGISCNIKEIFEKFSSEKISREIEKTCSKKTPLQNIFVKKIKVLEVGKTV